MTSLRLRLEEALKFDERLWRAFLTLKTIHREKFLDALVAALDVKVEDYTEREMRLMRERDEALLRAEKAERELAAHVRELEGVGETYGDYAKTVERDTAEAIAAWLDGEFEPPSYNENTHLVFACAVVDAIRAGAWRPERE